MNKKIFGFSILMLLIANTMPAIGFLNEEVSLNIFEEIPSGILFRPVLTINFYGKEGNEFEFTSIEADEINGPICEGNVKIVGNINKYSDGCFPHFAYTIPGLLFFAMTLLKIPFLFEYIDKLPGIYIFEKGEFVIRGKQILIVEQEEREETTLFCIFTGIRQ
jgi:hypothetical protein